ncbi:MAG: Hsp20/alpha crystallin family protein [Chitinophagaceae bacterium]
MSTQALMRPFEKRMSMFDDFFSPWNEWFEADNGFFGRTLSVPAVNVEENKDHYMVSIAAPGLKKQDFKIDIEGNMLSISCEKEEKREEKEAKYSRKEYNYSSFCRSFTIPDEVRKEKIEAKYEDGILKLTMPRMHAVKPEAVQQIEVR